ncbi:MAG: hypothetical protein EPN25_06665 [Nitrospirae bacterium]|nr:MAG: hypothetical protein EPN25_06665 [Nitrospirota bacterium]
MAATDIVITGAGVVSALGNTPEDLWSALLASQTGIRPVDGFPEGSSPLAAAQVSGIDPAELGIPRRDARIMGRHSGMLIKSSRDAYLRAGLDSRSVPAEETAFFAGMGMVDYRMDDLMPALLRSLNQDGSIDYDRFYSTGYQEIFPLWPLSMLNNISFCQAAINLDIRGENTVFSPHADSGAQAIAEGARTVSEGRAAAVLAGGVSEVVSPLSIARAGIFGLLGEPGKGSMTCRPFGEDRSGSVLGEGCGIVCLETRSSAEARGAAFSTMFMGYGNSCGKETGAACPSVDAIVQAMEQALDSAELNPADIGLIIAHGDGTLQGDRNEAEALRRVFQAGLPVYASKAALGNCLAAGPAIDIVLGSYMIAQGMIPAVFGLDTPSGSLGLRVVTQGPLRARPGKVLINAFSYEGQCTSLIIGAAD